MRQIAPPVPIVQTILDVQRMTNGDLWRLTTHCMRVERAEGSLLYHTLTGELLLLSPEEAEALKTLPGPVPPVLGELASRWFLRPEGADDMALADQTREIIERFVKKETVFTKYTIFTTTDCNARCFYCFEASWEKSSMTEQTARDTAKYIAEHCNGRKVHLRWFGGEPMVNVRAVDVITDSLRQQGVEFRSTMTSNGYLFNEALVQRAKNVWDLQEVIITLDGTEEVYNQRKAYVDPQGSPYRRVLRNIGLLLNAGIRVKARLNMDSENEQDLYVLVDELAERFAGKSGFGVIIMALNENAGTDPRQYTDKERFFYARKLQSMRAYVERKGVADRMPIKNMFAGNSCVADNDRATIVTPKGKLSRCEACVDGAIWGSIYSDEADEAVIRQWKERKPPEKSCKACPVYPQCLRLKKCPNWPEHCSPIERSFREGLLRRAVLGTYEDWKAAGQDRQAARSL